MGFPKQAFHHFCCLLPWIYPPLGSWKSDRFKGWNRDLQRAVWLESPRYMSTTVAGRYGKYPNYLQGLLYIPGGWPWDF